MLLFQSSIAAERISLLFIYLFPLHDYTRYSRLIIQKTTLILVLIQDFLFVSADLSQKRENL